MFRVAKRNTAISKSSVPTIGLMQRIRDECGDLGWFQLADKQVILLTGSEANEFFFRSPPMPT